MDIIKTEEWTDEDGKKRKHWLQSGFTITEFWDPTPKYIENIIKPRIEISNRQRKIEERGMKILEKMREIAKKELEKEEK